MRDEAVGTSARRIGEKLRQEMEAQGVSVEELANRAGKQVEHVQAVLDGYPNTTQRPTQLETVDDLARELGLQLDLSSAD